MERFHWHADIIVVLVVFIIICMPTNGIDNNWHGGYILCRSRGGVLQKGFEEQVKQQCPVLSLPPHEENFRPLSKETSIQYYVVAIAMFN